MRWTAALLLSVPMLAQQDLVDRGYQHFYNLDYDEALADFDKAATASPDSPDLHNHIAEAIVFREMYRNGALETELVSGNNAFLRRPKLNPTPDTDARFTNEVQKAIDLAQSRLARNPNDTGALYAMGIAYGLRSNYCFLVKKAWRDALRDATNSRKLHNRVSELDPSNVDARLVQGLHDYVVGSLPMVYRMLGFLAGFHGDKDRGLAIVQDVAAHGKANRLDAQIFLAALYRREGKPAKALPIVDELVHRFPRNYLLRFERAQMYSMLGNKREALAAVEEVAQMKTRGAPGFDRVAWEKVYYQLGTIQFWYNDLNQALENMRKVTANADQLDLNTGVLAWMRLGQIYDLTDRRPLAIEAYKKAIAYAPEAEAARESRRYLSTPYRRQRT